MNILTQTIARLLFLPIIIIALAVLVKGYADTGDGFSAGVIAATGILLQYMAFGYKLVDEQLPLRLGTGAVLAGLMLAFLVGFLPVLFGEPVFSHYPPPEPAGKVLHLGSLEFHSAVLFDVGVFLIVVGFVVRVIHLIIGVVERREQ
jgi:multisubunit Na+/H+ antiporter MnhB subunit